MSSDSQKQEHHSGASSLRFPKDFAWGVATAATQIEGAAHEDGKGESVWDHFARLPGRIAGGHTPEIACDHYRLYRKDVALMRRLGIRNYRFSIAWPRIYPEGRGATNRRGLDFYDRLIDCLLAAEITPWVTMFHWDLPMALEDIGGWRARAIPEAFGRYAETIVQAYGDRVKHWMTLNEMRSFTSLGYGSTERPPGVVEPPKVVNQTYHHALLAHGLGVRAVREYGGRGARVGIADDPTIPVPLIDNPAHAAAARRAFVELNARSLDPILRGQYSPAYFKITGRDRAELSRGDFTLIGAPIDFVGLNIYTGVYVRPAARTSYEILPFPPNYPAAGVPWLNHLPQALYWGPKLVRDLYGKRPIYITENGAADDDSPPVKGEIHDLHRRHYVRVCLSELHRGIIEGNPVRGYFLWSLMDNFEWMYGYTCRFGICYTDYATQRRIPKLSAGWYSEVVKQNRLV